MATIGIPWRLGAVTECARAVLLPLGTIVGRWHSCVLTLLRVAVSGVALCLVAIAYGEGCPGWSILLGLTAILFNPILLI